MKIMHLRRNYVLGLLFVAAGLNSLPVLGQTNLPYSSGSTGADGALTFRTIPIGGRYGTALAYDPVRNRTVLFGGFNQSLVSGGALGDTWSFDGSNWTKLNPPANPGRRSWARMVAVPWNGGQLVLFGGSDASGQRLNDTWVWNGTTWTQVNTPSSPSGRISPSMVYDAQRDKIVLFSGGGGANDTWLFDGTTWSSVTPPTSPPAWEQTIAAYDAERKKVVLLDYDGTWLWDGAVWTKANPSQEAPRSGRGGIAYDPVRKEVIVFGGERKNHTFAWNGSTWSERTPATLPPAVYSTEMTFDTAQGKIILFGGQVDGGDGISADTWTWDGGNWTFISGRTQYFDMSGRQNGIWNFTSITVPLGVSVEFIKNSQNTPVRWLAQENVVIEGNLVLDGGFGRNDLPEGVGGRGGPGAYDGGHGGIRVNRSGSNVGSPGQGPGGGLPGTIPTGETRDGKQALFATTPGGYGNIYLQPLVGGSGGGGGSSSDTVDGGNGGGGGGAILIASSRDIIVNGGISSQGGRVEYSGASLGGRGSGGGILLRADRISGNGTINATPDGRIRFEAYYRSLAGSTQPTSVNSAPVSTADFATTGALSIVSVKGVNVQQPPSGNTLTPDVIFTESGPVNVVVQGSNVPNGTPVTLRIATTSGVITPAPQNMNNNSVTFNVTVPKGIGTLQAFATFKIQ